MKRLRKLWNEIKSAMLGFAPALILCASMALAGCGDVSGDEVTAQSDLRLSDGTIVQPFQPGGRWNVGPLVIPAFDGCNAGAFTGAIQINPSSTRLININPEGAPSLWFVVNPCTGHSWNVPMAGTWNACSGSSASFPCSYVDLAVTDPDGYYWRILGNNVVTPVGNSSWPSTWLTAVIFEHPDGQYREMFNVHVNR